MTNPLIAKYEELYGKKEEPKAELVELSQEQSDILNKYLQNTNLPYAPPQSVATSNTGITAVNPSQTFTSKELEKTKSPVEKAYKDSYGFYPITDGMSGGDWHYLSWDAFQKGYNAAYEEKVVEEPEELKTLYRMFHENDWDAPNCDELCNTVKEWMSQYTHNVMTGEYLKGYEECMLVLKENLKND